MSKHPDLPNSAREGIRKAVRKAVAKGAARASSDPAKPAEVVIVRPNGSIVRRDASSGQFAPGSKNHGASKRGPRAG